MDYLYFKEYYTLIAIDLSKQQKQDADPKAIQQINFNENLNREESVTIFFIIVEAKETVLDLSIMILFRYKIIFDIKWPNITR